MMQERASTVCGVSPARDDASYMRRALELARSAELAGEVPVGAVLVLEGAPKSEGDDHFDADMALVTGELRQLVPELLATLGGELKREPAVAAPAEAALA